MDICSCPTMSGDKNIPEIDNNIMTFPTDRAKTWMDIEELNNTPAWNGSRVTLPR
ncbi:hypothetical protein [Paenibacillus sp. Soil750]|uniref:hypothetical protein n=1 Tax=Paenibacillus sp. Soil750 TaxID=1736398 RepID=UPI000AB473D6|nr:hypothetical protein [Paenibacillus sp. Soil750]